MKKTYSDILNIESLAEMYLDEGKFDKHLALWAKEHLKFESPFGNFTDSDNYIKWLEEFYNMSQKIGGTRRFVLNPVITKLDEDTAEFNGYLYILNKANGTSIGTALMKDLFKKTNEGWKFTYRSIKPDQNMSKLGQ